MNIKKFQAKTEEEAIKLAKEELGKDATIMNIKTTKQKGIRGLFQKATVEVTAAIEEPISYDGEKLLHEMKEIQQKAAKESAYKKKNIIEDILEEKDQTGTNSIEQKLDSLQDLLEKQMKEKEEDKTTSIEEKQEQKRNSCVELIYNQLINNEVDAQYADQVIKEIEKSISKDSSVDNVLASIYQKLVLKLGQPKTISIKEGETKFVYFIGPTGVGKTTTIAKIASNFKLVKKAKIALVTSDTYRIAAVDQLRTYANILGIPLKIVYSGEELTNMKEEYKNYDVVLVDTAGRSHRNREQRDDIESLIQAIPVEEREVYLVLSATTKYGDLIKITELYKEITDFNLIFTKLDETSCIGNIYNIKLFTGAPLSYTTWGQNVPDDIGHIDAQKIAKQLLGGND